MQTPISFALEILLDCETIEKAHKACRKYIKELERAPKPATSSLHPYRNDVMTGAPQQAPSTQRLLEQHSAAPIAAPHIAAPIPRGITGGEVNNGDGTKGKRKW